jgi:hypothetical protein
VIWVPSHLPACGLEALPLHIHTHIILHTHTE